MGKAHPALASLRGGRPVFSRPQKPFADDDDFMWLPTQGIATKRAPDKSCMSVRAMQRLLSVLQRLGATKLVFSLYHTAAESMMLLNTRTAS